KAAAIIGAAPSPQENALRFSPVPLLSDCERFDERLWVRVTMKSSLPGTPLQRTGKRRRSSRKPSVTTVRRIGYTPFAGTFGWSAGESVCVAVSFGCAAGSLASCACSGAAFSTGGSGLAVSNSSPGIGRGFLVTTGVVLLAG